MYSQQDYNQSKQIILVNQIQQIHLFSLKQQVNYDSLISFIMYQMIFIIISTVLLKISIVVLSTASYTHVATPMFSAYWRTVGNINNQNMQYINVSMPFYEPKTGISSSQIALAFGGMQINNPTVSTVRFCYVSATLSATNITLTIVTQGFMQVSFTLLISNTSYSSYFQVKKYVINEMGFTGFSTSLRTHVTSVSSPFSYAVFISDFFYIQQVSYPFYLAAVDLGVTGSNTINFKAKTGFGASVGNIGIVIIVYNQNIPSLAPFTSYSIYDFKYDNYQTNLNSVSTFLGPANVYGFQDKCMVVHVELKFTRNFILTFSTAPSNLLFSSDPTLQLHMFCLTMNYDCSTIDPYCIDCKSISICTSCASQYFLFGNMTLITTDCKSCSQLIFACIFCEATTPQPNPTVKCKTCQSPLYQLIGDACQLYNYSISNCIQCTPIDWTECMLPYVANNGVCKTCDQVIIGCTKCNKTDCFECIQGFVAWQGKCSACSNCFGCIQVTLNSDGSFKCLKCNNTQFQEAPVDNRCKCKKGQLSNYICHQSVGCITPYKQNGVLTCLFCNCTSTKLYRLMDKFILDGSGQCIDLCGDGFVMNNQTMYCDDGNLESGDGCSSNCSVQIGYRCQKGSQTSPSACKYQGIKPKLTVKYIERVEGSNSGTFEFSISPALISIGKLNLMNTLSLVCHSAQYSVSNVSYKNSLLTIIVDFTSDLQGLPCSLTLNYDQSQIAYKDSTLSFQAVSRNIPLIVSHTLDYYLTIEFIFRLLSYIVLGLFVVSLCHRMIGVELLFCSQMVYLSNCFNERSTFIMSSIKSLSVVSGGWSFFNSASDKQILYPFSDRVDIGKRFFQSNIFVASVIMILSLICFMLLICRYAKHKVQTQIITNRLTSAATTTIYRRFLMPISAGFLLVLSLSLFASQLYTSVVSQQIVSQQVNSLLLMNTWSVCATVTAIQVYSALARLQKGNKQSVDSFTSWYTSIFFLRSIFVSISIYLGIRLGQKITLFIITGIQLIYLVLMLVRRPYQRIIDMVGFVACQITVLYVLTLRVIQQYLKIQQTIQVLLMFILTGLMVIACILALVRISIEYKTVLQKIYHHLKVLCKKEQPNNILKDQSYSTLTKYSDQKRQFETRKYYNPLSTINKQKDSPNNPKDQKQIQKINQDATLVVAKQKLRQSFFLRKKVKK